MSAAARDRKAIEADIPVFDSSDPLYEQTAPRIRPNQDSDEYVFQRNDLMSGEDGTLLVYSSIHPAEGCYRGLNVEPQRAYVRRRRVKYILPAERGITSDSAEGLCIYCQLVLRSDAPEFAMHQPNFQLLLESRDRGCPLCDLLVVAFGRSSPRMKELYQDGHPELCDPAAEGVDITVQCTNHERHSRLVAYCGHQPKPEFESDALVWSTQERLRDLSLRHIWFNYSKPDPIPSVERLDLFKVWLTSCCGTHAKCSRAVMSTHRLLPTRVLEITDANGGDDSNPYTVRLHISSGEEAPYVALSHRWGSGELLTTLRSNLAEHLENIDFWGLPLTFRDAAFFTAYLGIKYLWIDSLCIVQDDQDDWQREAATMAAVYRNSTVTFAASAAHDASEGLQFQFNAAFGIARGSEADALVRFEDHERLDDLDQPLNSRAWAFQEAALSPRMICFTERQMLWKCNTLHESEDGLLHDVSDVLDDDDSDATWNIFSSIRQGQDVKRMYHFWYRMMHFYSFRSLTFEKDKLPALAGIIAQFTSVLEDTPMLGLWLGDFHNGLLWRAAGFVDRVEGSLQIPSWSWISAQGPVAWTEINRQYDESVAEKQASIDSVQVVWSGVPVTSPVVRTVLRATGRLRAARLWKMDLGNEKTIYHLRETSAGSTGFADDRKPTDAMEDGGAKAPDDLFGYCYLDTPLQADSQAWLFEISTFVRQLHDSAQQVETVHQVLVLLVEDADEQTFRRVGVGRVWTTPVLRFGYPESGGARPFEGCQQRAITVV